MLFNVVENSGEKIVVTLGNFKDFFHLKNNSFNYQVKLSAVHQERVGKTYEPKDAIGPGVIDQDKATLTVPVSATGIYIFKFFQENEKAFLAIIIKTVQS